jgi:aryl-alcohol dehydrogenase-like predicted oxidoreductase
MQTDRIDLYQIHMQDDGTPEEETLRALDDLVRHGKVLYLGCSNYAAYRLVESLWTSERLRLDHFVSLQAQYSLLVRDLEREHVPLCTKHGLGILPWSPLAGGFLSGKHERGAASEGSRLASPRFSSTFARFDDDRGWRTVDEVKAIARELSTTPTAVSLAWLLSRPAVSSVIFGARSIEQLRGNLAASGLTLPPEALTRLETASAFELGYPYDFLQRVQGRW